MILYKSHDGKLLFISSYDLMIDVSIYTSTYSGAFEKSVINLAICQFIKRVVIVDK